MPRDPFIVPESDEDLREAGLLNSGDTETEQTGESQVESSQSQERTYTQSEVDSIISAREAAVQKAKDREIGRLKTTLSTRDEELRAEREYIESLRDLSKPYFELDESANKVHDVLQKSKDSTTERLQSQLKTMSSQEEAESLFDQLWDATMQDLSDDVQDFGLSSNQFEEIAYRHAPKLMSTLDWADFRRNARADIRAIAKTSLASVSGSDKKEPPEKKVESEKPRARVPVSTVGTATVRRGTASDIDEMSDDELSKWEQEQIDQELGR